MIKFPSKTVLGMAVLGALLAFSAGAAEKKAPTEAAAERGAAPMPADDPMKIGPKGAKAGVPVAPKDMPEADKAAKKSADKRQSEKSAAKSAGKGQSDKATKKGQQTEAAAERGAAPMPAEDPMKIGPKGAQAGVPVVPKDMPKAETAGSPPRGTKDANVPGKSDKMANPKTPRAETDKDADKKK